MGQPCEVKSSGVHYDLGQTKGQGFKTGRRGVGRTKFEVVGPSDKLRISL